MGKTSCKEGQYYCNTDKKCKPIPDGYKVREDGFLVSEGSNPRIARKKGQPAKSKKHSDLYTDEDPKGTIHGLGFKDVATAKASVAKIRKSSRSHAHKIQAAIAMEQRARVMGKTSEAAVYRKFINSMKQKTKKMNEEKHGDHEPEMIRSQLKTAGRASKRIEKHSRKKDNFKAWVQSKITKASDYLDTAADYLDSKDMKEESNPRIPRKKGQPANSKKHSDLYTDENPKGTIHGLGFKNVDTAKASVSKIRNSSRSHAHKIQAAVAMEQRAREMGKTSEAAVYRKYINSMKKKTKSMKEEIKLTEFISPDLGYKGGEVIKKTTKKVKDFPKAVARVGVKGGVIGATALTGAALTKRLMKKSNNIKEQISFPQMQERIRNAKEKRREQQKKSEKLYMDTKKKGVKFYDKKGVGRLKDGKKVYD